MYWKPYRIMLVLKYGKRNISDASLDTKELDHLEMVGNHCSPTTSDIIADLMEDMVAEQKTRLTYDNILRLLHDQEVCEPIKFLRTR